MIISSWNIRGLNHPSKQLEVAKFIYDNNIDVMGIIETKVRIENEIFIKNKCFKNWDFVSNSCTSSTGRIWIGWNPSRINLQVLKITSQIINVWIETDDHTVSFFASFIYASNLGTDKDLMVGVEGF